MHSKYGLLSLFIFLSSLNQIYAIPKAIYGRDDRRDFHEITNPLLQTMARSVAAQIPEFFLKHNKQEARYKLRGPTLEARFNLCDGESFAKQLASAECSGFLISSNLLLTAGHCVKRSWSGDFPDCKRNRWVFDFRSDYHGQEDFSFPEKNVYGCAEVITQKIDPVAGQDYALIRLDRPVMGRRPLSYRTHGKLADDASLFVIGHPSGLPVKFAGNGQLRDNTNKYYFETNLDAFTGNSGSPVINRQNGLVEGLLIRGGKDYIRTEDQCSVGQVCNENGCRGEDVNRITEIKELREFN